MIMEQTVEEAAKKYSNDCRNRQLHCEPYCIVDFISGAEWQSKQSPWISVADAIPKNDAKGTCIVKYVDGSIDEMAMRKVNKWISPYIKTGYVTHWKPIPSFDEILEANRDVLERIKEKGD